MHRVVETSAAPAAIARSGDTVFYTDLASDELRSVGVDGSAAKILWKGEAALGDIAVDDSDVYFVEDGRIARIPRDGGRWDVVVDDASWVPADIALDDRFVYWTLGTSEQALIRRVAKNGGAPETIYDGPRGGFGISVSDGFVYFHGPDRTRADDESEFLMRVEAKPFGAVTELAHLDAHEMAIAGGEAFFAAKHGDAWTIDAVPTNGGAQRTVATLGAEQPYSLVASGGSLYWSHAQSFDWTLSEPAQHDAKVVALSIADGALTDIETHLDGAPLLAAAENACPAWSGPSAISAVDHCR